ncbi:hypothetical protein LXA43DRAFT_1176628 [Ganoderma leucocontextum]|nr:hypothetical protein LXA43DRAFT_1176628 [Ganoderma leucocontextum]
MYSTSSVRHPRSSIQTRSALLSKRAATIRRGVGEAVGSDHAVQLSEKGKTHLASLQNPDGSSMWKRGSPRACVRARATGACPPEQKRCRRSSSRTTSSVRSPRGPREGARFKQALRSPRPQAWRGTRRSRSRAPRSCASRVAPDGGRWQVRWKGARITRALAQRICGGTNAYIRTMMTRAIAMVDAPPALETGGMAPGLGGPDHDTHILRCGSPSGGSSAALCKYIRARPSKEERSGRRNCCKLPPWTATTTTRTSWKLDEARSIVRAASQPPQARV